MQRYKKISLMIIFLHYFEEKFGRIGEFVYLCTRKSEN
jgi:hypothetical protein